MQDQPDIALLQVEVLPESNDRLDRIRYDAQVGAFYARVSPNKIEASLTTSDVTLDLARDGTLVGIENIVPPRMWVPDPSVHLPSGPRGRVRFSRVRDWIVSDFDNTYALNPKEQVLHIVILPHEVNEIVDVSDRVRIGVDANGLMVGVWVALAQNDPPHS